MRRTLLSLLLLAALLLSLVTGLPLGARAADPAPGLTLRSTGGALEAQYTGPVSAPRLVAAGYDGSGRMQSVEMKTGKTARFSCDGKYEYRVFALDPETNAPLCQAASRIERFSGRVEVPCVDGAVAEATAAAVRQCLAARLALEEVLALDPTEAAGDPEVYAAQSAVLQRAMAAYDDMMTAGAVLYAVGTAQAEAGTEELAAQGTAPSLMGDSQEEALHWAQELTKQYDAIQSNRKLAALGEMMGCDARTAYQQFTIAQEILREHYEGKAATADRWVRGLTVVKTGCKVGMFVGACVATGGAVTVGQAAGLLVGATDTSIEIMKTGATLAFGDDSRQVKRLEEGFSPLSTAATIYSLLTFNFDEANAGEVIAFVGDWYQTVRENYGTVLDELKNFRKEGDILTAEVTSTQIGREELDRLREETREQGGEPDPETLAETRESLEENREAVTDGTLEGILKEAAVLEEGETLAEFERSRTMRDYQETVIEDMQTNDFDHDDGSEPPPPTYPMFHDNGPGATHRKVYWTDAQGRYVGLYEHYYRDVLESQAFYDDDGKPVWRCNYISAPIGDQGEEVLQRTHHYSYSNGTEVGSVITTTRYYFIEPYMYDQPPAEAVGRVSSVEQEIVQSYYDEEAQQEADRWVAYYESPRCDYDYQGNLAERNSGDGVFWKKKEIFDSKGALSMEVTDNGDGTLTQTSYYTKQQTDFPFDPTGHPNRLWVYTYQLGEYGFLNVSPGYGELVREERWDYGTRDTDHVYETGADGITRLVCFTRHYGYSHKQVQPSGKDLGFETVYSAVISP